MTNDFAWLAHQYSIPSGSLEPPGGSKTTARCIIQMFIQTFTFIYDNLQLQNMGPEDTPNHN